jgi:hypothetical protein
VAVRGPGTSSPEQEVKKVAAEFLEAAIDGRNGEACALTTKVEKCLGGLVLAASFLGEGGFEAVLGDDWREQLESAEVTFADDDHATIPPIGSDNEPTELVREDGEWLLVYED